jgi:hypothetical protein
MAEGGCIDARFVRKSCPRGLRLTEPWSKHALAFIRSGEKPIDEYGEITSGSIRMTRAEQDLRSFGK